MKNEVITVSGSKQCGSKVDKNSEHVVESFGNSEEAPLLDLSSLQKGSLCSRAGKICAESLLNCTTEVNQEDGGSHSQSNIVNEEKINSAEGMEVSGVLWGNKQWVKLDITRKLCQMDSLIYLLVYPQRPLLTTRTIELVGYDKLGSG